MAADEPSAEQQYSLRWNDFHASILSSFRHLRDQEDFVDVTLACDGCSFTAHKVVLSACSPYFRKLLKANPCQHPIVILRDVQQKDMESLLRFMYNGEVHIGQEQLSDFLKTAQMLQVRGLADVPTGAASHRLVTPPDHKISPNSSSLPWATDLHDSPRERGTSPPPIKRSRSSEHPSRAGGYTPDRGRSPSRGHSAVELRESLLGQALEGGPTLHTNSNNQKVQSDSSVQAQSTGEDSNSSDTALSERAAGTVTPKTEPADYGLLDDHHPLLNANGGIATPGSGLMDQARTPGFPGALLGLQGMGLPGLLPGPSGMHNSSADNFGAAVELTGTSGGVEHNVCYICQRVYSSAGNLRQHVLNVHAHTSEENWLECNICGKKYKTKHYLMNHQLQQHGVRQRARNITFDSQYLM